MPRTASKTVATNPTAKPAKKRAPKKRAKAYVPRAARIVRVTRTIGRSKRIRPDVPDPVPFRRFKLVNQAPGKQVKYVSFEALDASGFRLYEQRLLDETKPPLNYNDSVEWTAPPNSQLPLVYSVVVGLKVGQDGQAQKGSFVDPDGVGRVVVELDVYYIGFDANRRHRSNDHYWLHDGKSEASDPSPITFTP